VTDPHEQEADRLFQSTLGWIDLDQLHPADGTVLLQGEEVATPKSPDLPFVIHARPGDGAAFRLPEARTAVLRDVFFCPVFEVVFPSRRQVLKETVMAPGPFTKFHVPASLMVERKALPLRGTATALRARWNNHYHGLIDQLPRLMLLHQDYFRQFDEIQLLCPGGISQNEAYLLRRVGLPRNVKLRELAEEALVKPEQYLYLSFVTRLFCGHTPGWFRERVRKALLPDRPSRRRHRLLISRKKAGHRRILNYESLREALAPLGFVPCALERMTIREQIELFYDADAVVGTHGAGLANLLFADGARVVELFPGGFVLPHYYYLARSLGLPYRYCLASERADEPAAARGVLDDLAKSRDVDFVASPERVLSCLREIGVT
jgi:capsular polysaccharide biosynthesis protein